jgi:hypothetical protein
VNRSPVVLAVISLACSALAIVLHVARFLSRPRPPPTCAIAHTYTEGDVVMVTDVAEPLTIVSLVCRDGRWVPVSWPGDAR